MASTAKAHQEELMLQVEEMLAQMKALMGEGASAKPKAAAKPKGKTRGHYANGKTTRTALKRAVAREMFGKPRNELTDAQRKRSDAEAHKRFEAEHKSAAAPTSAPKATSKARKGTQGHPYPLKANAVTYLKAHPDAESVFYTDKATGQTVELLQNA